MKHPTIGRTYVLKNLGGWGLHTALHSEFASSDVHIDNGALLLCLGICSRMVSWKGSPLTLYRRIWLVRGRVLFDVPTDAEVNPSGTEDNIMNSLIEIASISNDESRILQW